MMHRSQSTTPGTSRRAPVIIDMATGSTTSMGGFWDTLATSAGDLIKNTVGTATTGAINTEMELRKIKAQAKIDEAKRAAAEAAKPKPTVTEQYQNYFPPSTPWYSDPKVMLPVAAGLAVVWYTMRKKRR